MLNQAPWLSPSSSSSSSGATSHERKRETGFWPRLLLTPNACGKGKPDEWIVTQGIKASMVFEEAVGVEVGRRGGGGVWSIWGLGMRVFRVISLMECKHPLAIFLGL